MMHPSGTTRCQVEDGVDLRSADTGDLVRTLSNLKRLRDLEFDDST